MRKRFAIALTACAAATVGAWAWFSNDPPEGTFPARLVAVVDIDTEGLGGLSGLDFTDNGNVLAMISDRGSFVIGTVVRQQGVPVALDFTAPRGLIDVATVETQVAQAPDWPLNDAEGLAVSADGTTHVSFEHEHRVQSFGPTGGEPQTPEYTPFWGALGMNQGLEALAVAQDGTLYAVPEGVARGAWETPVYQRARDSAWQAAFTLPVRPEFKPVGADFGPDGRLYLLERRLHPLGFYTRVRSMTLGPQGVADIRTELSTFRGTHGNLEGLAVWQDTEGRMRLTMVSDDNFLFFMRNQLVEYVIDRGVAAAGD